MQLIMPYKKSDKIDRIIEKCLTLVDGYRDREGLSERAVERHIGLAQAAISHMRHGQSQPRRVPQLETVLKIFDFFGLEIFGEKKENGLCTPGDRRGKKTKGKEMNHKK